VLQTNLLGTINILELARQTQADLLFLSTSRVYPIAALKSLKLEELPSRVAIAPAQTIPGASDQGISEDFPLTGHRSLYGATKLASELLIEEYRQAYGIRAIINRCGVITDLGRWAKSIKAFLYSGLQPITFKNRSTILALVAQVSRLETYCTLRLIKASYLSTRAFY
jgi:nucleoside-diphosphate-sugar epimerase